MQFLLVPIILLEITSYKFVSGQSAYSIKEDLRKLNATCPPYDTCLGEERRIVETDSLTNFNCHCSKVCVQLGTCCLDSPYLYVEGPKIRPTCRPMDNSKAYFMVDSCPPSDNKDGVWESLCQQEWNGEDDVMKIVPVTSMFTLITYKNYFCFRCHETTNDFFYWNVKLQSSDYEFDETIDKNKVPVNYDNYYNTWVAPLGIGGALIPVNLSLSIPNEIQPLPVRCEMGLISKCSDMWNDKDVSDKCEAYMGIIGIQRDYFQFKYKNAHCALCNFENLSNGVVCRSYGFAYDAKVPFSFTHLLDINRSDGDKVGKIKKCVGNFLWDPYAQKCRKLTCALPGYVVKDGKCTLP